LYQLVPCRRTVGCTWLLSIRMAAILSPFLVAGLKIVGFTQKPELRLT